MKRRIWEWKANFKDGQEMHLRKNKFLANQVDKYEAGMNGKGYMRDKSGDIKKVRISKDKFEKQKKKSLAGKWNLPWIKLKKPLKNCVKGKKFNSWK